MMTTPVSTDNTPFFQTLERMIRAAGARTAAGDGYDVAQLVRLRDVLEEQTAAAVRALRDQGQTWQGIAEALGVTRQACIMRWGKR